jgi:hypothetical protein
MDTNRAKWLSRKTWRRLVELHATGRISREQFVRLKDLLARERPRPDPAPAPKLRLVLARDEAGEARPRYLVPVAKEVA